MELLEGCSCSAYLLASGLIVVVYIAVNFHRRKKLIPNVSSRHVFITGCDSGFGRMLAIHLDKLDVKVYAGCYLKDSMSSLKMECSSKLMPVLIDITNTESVRDAADVVKQDLGRSGLWGLVNNAGVASAVGPIEFMTKQSFQKALDVNLLGAVDVTLAFLPLIKKTKEGRIVNMSSVAGRVTFASGGYSPSKHAMEAFSNGLSFDLESYGITTHTLNPGFYKTELILPHRIREMVQNMWDDAGEEVKKQYGEDFVEKTVKYKLKNMASSNLSEVVDAYTHALLAKYPQNRYSVGNAAKYFYIPMSYLPCLWQVKITTFLQRASGNPPVLPKNV